jgi:hypothetical protein
VIRLDCHLAWYSGLNQSWNVPRYVYYIFIEGSHCLSINFQIVPDAVVTKYSLLSPRATPLVDTQNTRPHKPHKTKCRCQFEDTTPTKCDLFNVPYCGKPIFPYCLYQTYFVQCQRIDKGVELILEVSPCIGAI